MASPLDSLAKEIGYADYEAYLASSCWKAFKSRYRKSGLPMQCRVCGRERAELHHVNYRRLGKEEFEDVIPLCRKHHAGAHGRNKSSGIVKRVVAYAKAQRASPISAKPLTLDNSTKAERRGVHRKRQQLRRGAARSKTAPCIGQYFIQCDCGRRAWQDGPHCCLCGQLAKVLRRKVR